MSEFLSIRRYRKSDKLAVLELHRIALEATDAWAKSGKWDDDLNHIEVVYLKYGEFLVGEVNGRIVAMGALRRVSDGVGELKRMRVHPDFQRRGYGQIILTALENKAKELGYSKLVLDTTVKQTAAQELYLKNGYRETRREHIETPNISTNFIFYEKTIQ